MSLLERFRGAVFRLMMISALSNSPRVKTRPPPPPSTYHRRAHSYLPHDDPHHSEAVADCIEFIKKTSATDDDDGRCDYNSAGNSSRCCSNPNDSSLMPVPVIM
ncbi:hypothetical protein LINPERPRIM_LOCUS2772 [Linum perenne]